MTNDELMTMLTDLGDQTPEMPDDVHSAWVDRLHSIQQESPDHRTPWLKAVSIAATLVLLIGGTALERANHSAPAALPDYNYSATYASDDPVDGLAYTRSTSSNLMGTSAPMYGAEMAKQAYDSLSSSANGIGMVDSTRKIIRNVKLSLTVRGYDDAVQAVRSLVQQSGGYIASSSESVSTSGLHSASFELRIPAGAGEDTVSQLIELGRLKKRTESADDVTESYQDYQSRLETQKALLTRLTQLLADADQMTDILDIESRIAQVQSNIDYYTRILMQTDDRVNFMTVSLSISEESAVSTAITSPSLWERIVSGFTTGFDFFVDFIQDMLVFTVSILPFGFLLAVLIFAIRFRRKSKRGKSPKF